MVSAYFKIGSSAYTVCGDFEYLYSFISINFFSVKVDGSDVTQGSVYIKIFPDSWVDESSGIFPDSWLIPGSLPSTLTTKKSEDEIFSQQDTVYYNFSQNPKSTNIQNPQTV